MVDLDEDDIQISKKQCKSMFITYEMLPVNFTIKDISEVL